jgi:predicted transcriptional regulator of viral defense system
VPRHASSGKEPSWQRLYAAAEPQSGYFTTDDAAKAGFTPQLLRYHVTTGKAAHAGPRGIYRLTMFPPGDHEDLVVAWLWTGRDGVVSHESALALNELSDAMPAKIHLSVPAAWAKRRLRVPPNIVIHPVDVAARDRAFVGAVPVTKPRRTIEDCIRDHVAPDLVADAIREARKRGAITAAETKSLQLLRRKAAA